MALVIILALFGLFIICSRYYYEFFAPEKENKAKKETAHLISYDRESMTATLYARDPSLQKILSIVDAEDFTIKYEPEEIHFGAVSVGGVVSGGTYKTGGFNYIAHTAKSGFCNLTYGKDWVRKIRLSDELYKQAEKSHIAPYLNRYSKQIDVHDDVIYSEEEKCEMLYNLQTIGYVGNNKRGYPTPEKCSVILNWICGYDN